MGSETFTDGDEKYLGMHPHNPAPQPDRPISIRVGNHGGGLRYDAGKNRLDLLPPEWPWALGLVLTKGAEKYAVRNWEKGMPWSKVLGPMVRHIIKFLMGERYDVGTPEEPGTGCHHLAMVAWNALALMSYDIREIGENDIQVGDMKWLEKCSTKPMSKESPDTK